MAKNMKMNLSKIYTLIITKTLQQVPYALLS